jgi:hypothetical protein
VPSTTIKPQAREPALNPDRRFQEALVLHRQGQLARARPVYEQILSIQPRHVEALHLLGTIEYQTGNAARAVALIGEAVKLDPGNAVAHCNLGSALQALKDFDAALASFDRALSIDPRYADAYYNRGNLLKDLNVLDAALASYDRALALRPLFAAACCNRGAVLQRLGRLDAALASYDRAVAINPDYAEAHRNRAAVLQRLRKFEAALAACERAIALRGDFAEAHCDRSVILYELGRLDEAVQSCNRALALKPDYAAAYSNRGAALHDLGQLAAAVASYEQAIALDGGFAKAHLNMSLTCLLAGDFARGWREHEWRFRTESGIGDSRHTARPLWLGEQPIAGKSILLHSERGLGDTIQFCRYARLAAERGATVILEVQGPLKELLSSLDGAAQVLARGEPLPPFDYHCPLLSLPLAFNTTLATIPAQIPYIKSSPAKRLDWRERLGVTGKLRVGLVWSGGFRPNEPEFWSVNERRNIPLAKLVTLAHPEVEFLSLQKGAEAETELKDLLAARWDGPPIADWSALLQDFSDTAALIEHLDLVISVDTSTAHLAGAMGKPVWLLNRFDTCWRWLLDRSDSPWYPTLRVYRQERAGDWDGIVHRVGTDLKRLVASR